MNKDKLVDYLRNQRNFFMENYIPKSNKELELQYFLSNNVYLKNKIIKGIKSKIDWAKRFSFEILRELTELGDLCAKEILIKEISTLFENVKEDYKKGTLVDFISNYLTTEKYLAFAEKILNINEFDFLKSLVAEINTITKFHYYFRGKYPVFYKQKLHLTNQKLESIPNSLKMNNKFVQLHLDHNNIKETPKWIGQYRNLEGLTLSHNKITDLPESIGNLENLISLDVSFNQLEQLPESIFKLRNLKYH